MIIAHHNTVTTSSKGFLKQNILALLYLGFFTFTKNKTVGAGGRYFFSSCVPFFTGKTDFCLLHITLLHPAPLLLFFLKKKISRFFSFFFFNLLPKPPSEKTPRWNVFKILLSNAIFSSFRFLLSPSFFVFPPSCWCKQKDKYLHLLENLCHQLKKKNVVYTFYGSPRRRFSKKKKEGGVLILDFFKTCSLPCAVPPPSIPQRCFRSSRTVLYSVSSMEDTKRHST